MGIDLQEYQNRVNLFQEKMKSLNLEAALITQMADLFYLSGTGQNCHLFIPAEGKPILIAYKDINRAKSESVWETIPIRSQRQIPEVIKEAGYTNIKRLGFEFDSISYKMALRYQKMFPETEWEDVSSTIRKLRSVKSESELEELRYSAAKHTEVFRHIENFMKPGMTELEIAAEFESYARKLGHQGSERFRGEEQGMKSGLVGAGANSAKTSRYDMPLAGPGLAPLYPSGPGMRRWEEGENLMIDYAGIFSNYTVDQTRNYFAGEVDPKLKKAQEVAEEIINKVAEEAKPGAVTGELYEMAVKMAEKAGFGEHFMGCGFQVPYIGHGVGLELNELPVLAKGDKTVLQENMVIAVEPKIVFPGLGSAGIENTYIIKENGAVALTK
ncbi:MAG: hypothetical protein PWR14_508 [Thermosediminibacterales bacterium]|nr:hypothetical protein [Thermosediminibacterales bacterium]